MPRVESLFASGTAAMLIAGLTVTEFGSRYGISIWHRGGGFGSSIGLAPQTPCYGLAALFSLFAFIYSADRLPIDRTAALWHFGLSIAGIILLVFGLICIDSTAHLPTRLANAYFADGFTMMLVLGGIVLFAFAQLLFALSVILAILRAAGALSGGQK